MELARDLNPPQRPHSRGNPSPVNVKLKVSASYVSRERAGGAYSFPVVFKTRATNSDRKRVGSTNVKSHLFLPLHSFFSHFEVYRE